MQVIFKLLDGREFKGVFRVPIPMADRVAFEEQFQRGSVALAAIQNAFETDDEGKPVTDGEGNPKLKKDADITHVRDQYMAFLAWRAVRRVNPVGAGHSFSEFIDQVDELEFADDKLKVVEGAGEDDAENPTDRAAQAT